MTGSVSNASHWGRRPPGHPCPESTAESRRAADNAHRLARETRWVAPAVDSTVERVDRVVEEIVAERARNHFVETIATVLAPSE